MSKKIVALNKKVKQHLDHNFTVYLVWRAKFDLIDSDIDPVHNEAWRKEQEQKEEEQIKAIINFVEECRKEEY